jgi:hypothetical protein
LKTSRQRGIDQAQRSTGLRTREGWRVSTRHTAGAAGVQGPAEERQGTGSSPIGLLRLLGAMDATPWRRTRTQARVSSVPFRKGLKGRREIHCACTSQKRRRMDSPSPEDMLHSPGRRESPAGPAGLQTTGRRDPGAVPRAVVLPAFQALLSGIWPGWTVHATTGQPESTGRITRRSHGRRTSVLRRGTGLRDPGARLQDPHLVSSATAVISFALSALQKSSWPPPGPRPLRGAQPRL